MISSRCAGQFALAILIFAIPAALAVLTPPAPWLWFLGVEWILFLLATAAARGRARLLLVNIGLVLLVLFGYEAVLTIGAADEPKPRFTGNYTGNYCDRDHSILGYAPYPDSVVSSTKYVGDKWIYSVTYTIGPDALRVTPVPGKNVETSVLFFGDSFMFGEGVEDVETMPYRVGILTDGRYAIHNFGLHGYGPHHMLVALERGYVRERVERPPVCAVYMGAAFQAERIVGPPWKRNGPRYVLNDQGNVEYRGRFCDNKSRTDYVLWWIRRRVEWSALGRQILARLSPDYQQNRDLYVAIINAARHRIEQDYPGCEFHVIIWDRTSDDRDLVRRLELIGLRVHRITEIIPDIIENAPRYRIDDLDHHPSPAALDLAARYVVESILKDGTSLP